MFVHSRNGERDSGRKRFQKDLGRYVTPESSRGDFNSVIGCHELTKNCVLSSFHKDTSAKQRHTKAFLKRLK